MFSSPRVMCSGGWVQVIKAGESDATRKAGMCSVCQSSHGLRCRSAPTTGSRQLTIDIWWTNRRSWKMSLLDGNYTNYAAGPRVAARPSGSGNFPASLTRQWDNRTTTVADTYIHTFTRIISALSKERLKCGCALTAQKSHAHSAFEVKASRLPSTP